MILDGHVRDAPEHGGRGIVHPSVDAAEPFDRPVRDGLERRAVRDVGLDREAPGAGPVEFGRERLQRLPIARDDDDIGASRGQHPRRGEPDPAGCARDDDDLAVEGLRREHLASPEPGQA